ncbi:MAG: hypothetical protein ACE5JZ_04105 [Kiloniellales bacterium]
MSGPTAVPGPTRRRCLRCRQWFASAGAHNRICEACKDSRMWREAAAAIDRGASIVRPRTRRKPGHA